MNELSSILLKSADPTVVSLEFQNITDLTNLIPRLARLKKLHTLYLHGNHFPTLPRDIGTLGALEVLDISQNPFRSMVDIINQLKSIPNLINLNVSFPRGKEEEEEEIVVMGLPNLQVLNGAAIASNSNTRNSSGMKEEEENEGNVGPPNPSSLPPLVGIPPDDIRAVSALFASIKNAKVGRDSDSSRRLAMAFDSHVKTVANRLTERLRDIGDGNRGQQECELVMAKHGLYDICFQELIGFADSGKQPEMGNLLRRMRAAHTSLFHAFPTILQLVSAHAENSSAIISELERAEQEVSQLMEAADMLEKEAEEHQSEIVRLREEVGRLKRELKGPAFMEMASMQNSPRKVGNNISSPTNPKKAPKSGPPPTNEEYATLTRDLIEQGAVSRNLTVHQMREFMELIYVSKVHYDERCKNNGMARETMEQHMYTFLNQRYGLKTLIVENAAAIFKSVTRFSDTVLSLFCFLSKSNFYFCCDFLLSNRITILLYSGRFYKMR